MIGVNRLKVIQDVVDRRLTTHLAAERLDISDRHCRRLLQRYRAISPEFISHASGGIECRKPSDPRGTEDCRNAIDATVHGGSFTKSPDKTW